MTIDDLDGDGDLDLASSTGSSLHVLLRGSESWTDLVKFFPGPNTNPMSTMAIHFHLASRRQLLFQRASSFEVLEFVDQELRTGGTLEQEDIELLRPFDGYDQLVPLLPSSGCDDFGLAVGTFVDQPSVPRRLNVLSFTETGYRAREVPAGPNVVLAAGVGLKGTTFTGVLSAYRGVYEFRLFAHSGCAIELLGVWATAPVSGFLDRGGTADELLFANAGERMLAFSTPSGLRFQHFDGVNLHQYEMSLGGEDFSEAAFSP